LEAKVQRSALTDALATRLGTHMDLVESQLFDISARLNMCQPIIPIPVQAPPGFEQQAMAIGQPDAERSPEKDDAPNELQQRQQQRAILRREYTNEEKEENEDNAGNGRSVRVKLFNLYDGERTDGTTQTEAKDKVSKKEEGEEEEEEHEEHDEDEEDEKHAAEDDISERIEANYDLEQYCFTMRKTLQEGNAKDQLEANGMNKIETAVQEMFDWLDKQFLAEEDAFEGKRTEREGILNLIKVKADQMEAKSGLTHAAFVIQSAFRRHRARERDKLLDNNMKLMRLIQSNFDKIDQFVASVDALATEYGTV